VLDVVGVPFDDAMIAAWRARVERAGSSLGWRNRQTVARKHAGGVSLAIAAAYDQLFLATEINEWALCAALIERDPACGPALERALADAAQESADESAEESPTNTAIPAPHVQPVLEESAAFARFAHLAALEARPALRALLEEAATRALPHVLDDTELTLGAGIGGRTFSMTELPEVADVRWQDLRDIPTAIVTGSNGKTTTVRLLAACTRMNGWHTGYNCTDGVFLDDQALATGDYSGPAGARMVMRDRRTQAAILETARGGILRRGIAVSQANTAVVTNVSQDHFGEYGIHDLEALAQVKLAVAAVVGHRGLLVLNADDARLRTQADDLMRRYGRRPSLGWFSVSADQRSLHEYGMRGDSTCGVKEGRLHLNHAGAEHDLGPIVAMPLSLSGIAAYNVANMAGAALAAVALGVLAETIAEVFSRFGSNLNDNPGRMMRFERNGVTILVDYAHNPEGLRVFLKVADHLRVGTGRLGLLLGHAGNRKNEDIEELAQAAAQFQPALVVVKEDEAHLRGRAPGEIPRILRAELERLGFAGASLPMANSEAEAARYALDWARPGDVLAFPVHSSDARATVIAMLGER
jgi:cyanophycin synthetase